MSTTKEKLKQIVENLKDEDLEHEYNEFAKNPDKVTKELEKVTEELSEEEIQQGVKRFGSGERFLQVILLYFAYKAALVRKGVQVGVAAGAGGVILFGAGSLSHAVANASEVASLDEIGNGIEMAADLPVDISDVGIEVASESADFISSICEFITDFGA
jgi:hypothetical protein